MRSMEKATSFKSDCELMMMPVDHHELLVEDALALRVEGGAHLAPRARARPWA